MFAIVGPTGTGKSALAVKIALALRARGVNAEIINADAMQLYRGMDIGTAKLSITERCEVPHHLLDVLEPSAEASVNAYQREATKIIAQITASGAVPILVGGSGLYVNSVLYEMRFAPHSSEIRARLETELAHSGFAALVTRLCSMDAAAATTVDLQNPRRVVRALEVLELTGQPLAAQLPANPRLLRPTTVIGINEERSVLTARLDARVLSMWQNGLLGEAAGLLEQGIQQSKTASQAIGYAQAIAVLSGQLSESEAIATTQQLTRRYARRQVSWFKRLPQLRWITTAESQDSDTVAALILSHAQQAVQASTAPQVCPEVQEESCCS